MLHELIRQTAATLAIGLSCVLAGSCFAASADKDQARNLVLQSVKPQAATFQRLALVVGNSAYKDAPLSNPVNDARAMAKALEAAGFKVMLHTDVDHRGLLGAVRDFGTRLRLGGVGVFYFAGHGMQIKGRNYLIPIGADIQREDEVAYAALDAQAVLDKMEAAGNGANLMILDACRNNPFVRSFRSSSQGLAQMDAPVGTLVAFATAPGTVASDGQGANGLYTKHLLEAMSRPGSKVEEVFKQVRAAVRRDSQGKQIPWESTSLEGDLYFVEPPLPVAEPTPPDPAQALDTALWEAVRTSTQPVEVRAYLNRFPHGMYAAQAQSLLSKLDATQGNAVTTLPPVVQQQVVVAPTSPVPSSSSLPPGSTATAEFTGSLWTVDLAMAARARLMNEGEKAGGGVASSNDHAGAQAAGIPGRATNDVAAPQPSQPSPTVNQSPIHAENLVAAIPRKDPAEIPSDDRALESADRLAARGPRAGDTWSYKRIDKWRADATDQYTLILDGIDSAGRMSIRGIDVDGDPLHHFYWLMLQPSAFGVNVAPQHGVWWSGMMPGETKRVTLNSGFRRGDRSIVQADLSATIEHKGIDRIRVPAGTFDALHLEVSGQFDFLGLNPPQPIRRFWSMSLWYVPALRAYAARELEVRSAGTGRSDAKHRHELTGSTLGARLDRQSVSKVEAVSQ